jgi:hypothetical protein
MQPRMFEEMTTTLGAPPGHEDRVQALPIKREEADGVVMVLSVWRPSPEEREALSRNADIVLRVWGRTMPPVKLTVGEVA